MNIQLKHCINAIQLNVEFCHFVHKCFVSIFFLSFFFLYLSCRLLSDNNELTYTITFSNIVCIFPLDKQKARNDDTTKMCSHRHTINFLTQRHFEPQNERINQYASEVKMSIKSHAFWKTIEKYGNKKNRQRTKSGVQRKWDFPFGACLVHMC